MKRLLPVALLFPMAVFAGVRAPAQVEGPVPTQVLVNVDAKSTPPASASEVMVSVNDHKEPLTAWTPVAPANAQVALLIDDGLREQVGRELSSLRAFVLNLPLGTEVLVGYMRDGEVVSENPFTTDHARAAATLRLPGGTPGLSASPYICLSDFVKHWPGSAASGSAGSADYSGGALASGQHKARFVMMITSGVDPYNGSTGVLNQGSPYVDTAAEDAQRAGVAVSAIYFGDAGIYGRSADNSGQYYLAQVTAATGGINYWEGVGNPVSAAPYLDSFQHAIAETYVATFIAPAGRNSERDMVRVKFSAPHSKLHTAEQVRPGNQE